MRRASAILLLIAFSLPLIAAPFADSDSNLPACCRRLGKHHCGMVTGDSSSGPALARRDCPYLPTLSAVAVPAVVVLPQSSSVSTSPIVIVQPAVLVRSRHRCGVSLDKSHQKRGPPSLLY